VTFLTGRLTFNPAISADMPQYFLRELPEELYDEIIGYLWNDMPSLMACSLANQTMTILSQKRLFYCIALSAQSPHCPTYSRRTVTVLCGTSYNFRQLLLRSPHIAKYVVSLHLVDHFFISRSDAEVLGRVRHPVPESASNDGAQYIGYKLANGEDINLDASLVPMRGLYHKSRYHRWLPNDKFLPLCAPLLCNLRALSVSHDESWYHFSSRVLITLLNLVQLRSLRYLHIDGDRRPGTIIDQAIGENVKHLFLRGDAHKDPPSVRLPHPPLAPVYLESLSIDEQAFSGLSDGWPNCRIRISRLRKLVVRAVDIRHHNAIWSLLQSCSATLQDFEITPSNHGKTRCL